MSAVADNRHYHPFYTVLHMANFIKPVNRKRASIYLGG
jgi:hypothetical protein